MAEDESTDFFLDLDDEVLRRIRGKSTFGRSVNSESSLRIFVTKRAKPGFVGFVDVTTLAPVTSPHNRGVRVFNVVFNPEVSSSLENLQSSFEHQIKYLSHSRYGPPARQLLLTTTLPHHDYELNLATLVVISDCLLTDCPTIRKDAASRLERLLVVTDPRDIHAVKHQLLYVAQKTHQIVSADPMMADPRLQDDDHIRRCGHLHLLSVTFLLCRVAHRPTLEECSSFLTWPKLNKKHTGRDVRQEVLKLMNALYERLDKHLKDPKPKTIAQVRQEKKSFHKASFYDQISTFFLILNEVATGEWNEESKGRLEELLTLYDIVVKEGKKWKPECRAGIDTLLVRSLVIILKTTLAKFRQEIGDEGDYSHPVLAARLLDMVVGRVSEELLDDLIPCLSTVAFHENPEVRAILTEQLEKSGCPPLHYTLHHLNDSISVTDFHVDVYHTQPGESRGALDECSWHVLKGRFGKETADCFVFVHAGCCQAKTSWSTDCTDYGNWVECGEWQRHKQNLEMLAKLCPHDNLIKLMAFQLSPYLFYATESLKGRRLLEHLINHRSAHRWLDVPTLCRVMHDILTGLEYLTSRQIASRDVTTYNIMVSGRSRRGGVAGEMTDILMTDDFSVKLASLELTHQFRGTDRKHVRFVRKNDPVPLLWTPPEALLRGEYSELSMVYSAGCVMYELWTHGCQPFTSFQKTTAYTIRMMLLMPDSVPLIHWPCIPNDVYDIMKKCTSPDPAARPSLPALKLKFMDIHTKKREADGSVGFDVDAEKKLAYPSFCDDQVQRKHVPEKGIPEEVQQIIDDYSVNHFDSYRNMRSSRWMDYAAHSSVGGASELSSSSEWMETAYRENYTSVREKFTTKFRKDVLPLLEKCATNASSELPGVTDWMKTPENKPILEEDSADHIVHERRYEPSWSLMDAACKGVLAVSQSGYVAMGVERQLRVLLALSRAVQALHEAGWLHRDIRASSVLVGCDSGEAILARVGRMCRLGSANSSALDEPFDDTWRWLAPEVLTEGKFGKENDVFMLGTAFWEVFWIRQVSERNPTATDIHYAPFANHEKADIIALVREGKRLPKPTLCPDWLYQLSIKCRDPDPANRPTAEDLVNTLDEQLASSRGPERPFLSHPKLLSQLRDEEGEYDTVPELPTRFRQRKCHPPMQPELRRDSGIDEDSRRALPPLPSPAGAAARPINLDSIRLTDTSSLDPDAEPNKGYLTPTSEVVQSVVRSRQGSGWSGSPSPRSSATGDVFFRDDGFEDDDTLALPERHISRKTLLPGSKKFADLGPGRDPRSRGGAEALKGGSLMFRNIPGLDFSSSDSSGGSYGRRHQSLQLPSRPLPETPPEDWRRLPVKLDDEESVYSVINELPKEETELQQQLSD